MAQKWRFDLVLVVEVVVPPSVRRVADPCEKRHSFLNFPYVCPEPVLLK